MDKIDLAIYNALRHFLMNHRGMCFTEATNNVNSEEIFKSIIAMSAEYKKTKDLSAVIKTFGNNNKCVEEMILIESYIQRYL